MHLPITLIPKKLSNNYFISVSIEHDETTAVTEEKMCPNEGQKFKISDLLMRERVEHISFQVRLTYKNCLSNILSY